VRASEQLHNLGQSLWLDNITLDLLDSGTLERCIDELSVTGLTSSPTIFDHAITHSKPHDSEILRFFVEIGQQVYVAYRDLLETDRWQRLANGGAHPQRLLFASTGTKDPKASDVLYIGSLAAPNTINTVPEETWLAFSAHGRVDGVIPRNGGDCDQVLAEFGRVGIDLAKLGADLQKQGAESFDDSWRDLLKALETKSTALK
jgi:transaldolase